MSGEGDEKRKRRTPSPYNNASFLSKITFAWLWPVLGKIYRQSLHEEDLFTIRDEDDSRTLGDSIHREWENEHLQSRKHKREARFAFALLRCFKTCIIKINLLLFFLELIMKFIQPYLLLGFIRCFSGEEGYTVTLAWLYAGGIGAASYINTILQHTYFWVSEQLGMKMRIASCALIYRKMLRISPAAANNQVPVGQLVNILSNDVLRFDIANAFVFYFWISPLQIIIATGILWSEIGPSCLAGIMSCLLVIPFQSLIGYMFAKFRRATAMCTDKRVCLIHEVINSIRAIKMYTWEKLFIAAVEIARKNEITVLKRVSILRAANTSLSSCLAKGFVFLCLLTYVYTGHLLQADKVYLTVALINSLQFSISVSFPLAILGVSELVTSCQRLQSILEMQEKADEKLISVIKPRPKLKDCGLVVHGVSARWRSTTMKNTLNCVTCSVSAGELLVITGPVGSGKGSFLHVILGELPLLSGKVSVQGKIAYAAQEPWVFSGTVRENILFGEPFRENKYSEVVKVCALKPDFKLFPKGDLTLVGENGAALSGGQKARINLARAIYSDADIYLLDDPLSAVDTHVGRYIFDKCMMKYLKSKVRVLVTHQMQYLKAASSILVLREGHMEIFGSYQELMNKGFDLGSVVQKNANPASSQGIAKSKQDKNANQEDRENENKSTTGADERRNSAVSVASDTVLPEDSKKVEGPKEKRDFVVEEGILTGGVGISVLFRFLRTGSSWPILLLFAVGNITVQLLVSGVDYWLSYWTNGEQLRAAMMSNQSMWNMNTSISDIPPVDGYLDPDTNSYIYIGLVTALLVGAYLRIYLLYRVCLSCSYAVHNTMLGAIVRAPIKYFEIHPVGQILNRFSKDLGQVDEILPPQLGDAVTIVLTILGGIALVVSVNLWLLLPSVIVLIIYLLMCRFYVPTLCNVKRLEAVTRSPVFTHLSTSLQGLTTVRAFGVQKDFMDQFDDLQNLHTSAWFMYLCLRRWFCLYLDLASSTYITTVVLSFMVLSDSLGGDVGLAITSAMALSLSVMWCLRQITEFQNQLTSVERLLEFCDVQPEAPWEIKDKTPRADWPQHGAIAFENVSLKYNKYEPAVLKNLSFYIKGSEKIGIVGRTGAGKSSLISSVYRLTEPSGDICIDGICVGELGLHDLRGCLSIIPQEPAIFSGTVRKNLDPNNQAPDEEVWKVLEEVQLKKVVSEMQGGLDADITEGGSNLSVGQRQLLCLARVILTHKKILILDEASANIDLRTDKLIQEIIRTKFKDCTVLTIAHRLQTIIDCDRVMVLQAGQLVEFEEPHILLMDNTSLFSSLVAQTNPGTARQLHLMAEHAYLRRRDILGKL